MWPNDGMWRIWTLFIFFCIVFLGVIGRIFTLSIIQGDEWHQKADQEHYIQLDLPATRGSIRDINSSPLVLNQPAFLVYGQPKLITSPGEFSILVSHSLHLEAKDIAAVINTPDRFWVPLAHKVNQTVVDELEAAHIVGLGFEPESKRLYPEASMAAHLLGFVGSNQIGTDQGYFGLEGFYERVLHGKDGKLLQEKDVNGMPIIVGTNDRIDAQNGSTLVLWLDRAVQKIVEEKLNEGIEKYGAKSGTVTIMDPRTGGIVAMAGYPSYDPTDYTKYPKETYTNPVVAFSYEPGSTFKVLIMAAGIEENLVKPDTKMDESGPVKIGEYYIRTWDNQYHGQTSMIDVLVHSSNVGMVFVARKLGLERMLSYIHKYGFGQPTKIDLQEESSPSLRPDQDWHEIDLATASFGQGIAVTPVQMVRAVAALANEGKLMEPKVVKQIIDARGRSVEIKPTIIRKVVSPQTAHEITEMMVTSVENGEAKFAKIKGYRIAGKTGTAQIPVAGHYDDKKTIASFVGFAPADNPKFVMLVTLQEPSASQWGSETAAPLFFSIAKELFNYYGIPPQL
jgi:stage V sporulation protein D (sporulation-specific penicillin-binding protein)